MSVHNTLELALTEILHVINPLREDWETRMQIIDELGDVVKTIESLRGATVEPFGSFLSQLFTRWGDLDISIELSNGLHIASAAKKHKQALLADLLKALRKIGGFKKLQFVLNARVPILKLESRLQNISCDISINNLSGHVKSKFLLWISLIDRRFRDLVLLVKEWAKANNINNSKMGTFNSYSLSLLVIFHFQTCVPAILPPLKDLYPGNMADELIGVRAEVERRIEEVATANIAKFRKERRVNRSSLSELFASFFTKFRDISSRAAEQGICTYTGRWEDVSTNTRWLPRTYAIFIEDPFEQPENTARGVSSNQLTRISQVFINTYHNLFTPNQTRNTLIPSLVRHEISRFFPGVPFANIGINGGVYSRTNKKNIRYRNSSQSSHLNNGTTESNQVPRGARGANRQSSKNNGNTASNQVPRGSRGANRQNNDTTESNQVPRQAQGANQQSSKNNVTIESNQVPRGAQGANQQSLMNNVTTESNQVPREAWGANRQSLKNKPASGNQPHKVTGQGALPVSSGPASRVPPHMVQQKLPQTSLPRQVNNVLPQRPVQAPQGQAQQVWRPKHSDK